MVSMIREDFDPSTGVLEITLDMNTMNTFSLDAYRAFSECLDAWAQNDGLRVMILASASESFFSNGLDPAMFVDQPEPHVRAFVEAAVGTNARLFEFPVPILAAINGHCMAAGAVSAMCCDWRFMAERGGRIGFPEANIALNFPVFATARLRELVGERMCRDLLFTGKLLKPEEALQCGLIDEVIPADSLRAEVRKRALKLAKLRPNSLRGFKIALRKEDYQFGRDVAQFDIDELVRVSMTPDGQAGLRSLIEGGRPRFDQ